MKTIKLMVAMLLLTVGLAACSNKEEAVKVAEKIEKGVTLDKGDYTAIITYLGKYAEKAQPIQDQINNLPDNSPEVKGLTDQLSTLRESNKYIDLFSGVLDKATQEEVGEDNVALVNKYAGYEWFDAPAWATLNEDPGVEGMILQTPPANGDTGVVAGAVDDETVHAL